MGVAVFCHGCLSCPLQRYGREMRGEKTESAVWIWKRICIFAVEEIYED